MHNVEAVLCWRVVTNVTTDSTIVSICLDQFGSFDISKINNNIFDSFETNCYVIQSPFNNEGAIFVLIVIITVKYGTNTEDTIKTRYCQSKKVRSREPK